MKCATNRSCLIDGKAFVYNKDGLPVFELVLGHRTGTSAEYCTFDLLELDGEDLRHEPIESRKKSLAKLLRGSHLGIVLNQPYEEDGAIVFAKLVSLAARASYRNGLARLTVQADHRFG